MKLKALILAVALGLSSPLAAQPERTTPPAAAAPGELVLPSVHKATLSNGLAVWVVERHEVPVVQLDLVLKAGAERDPADAFGLASFTSDLLTEGAGGKNALQLADELDYLGATLEASSGFDAATVGLYVPVARLQPALELMRLVVTEPDFPAEELERRRAELLTDFLQARDDPSGLMSLAFPTTLFSAEHRYGALVSGREEVIKGLSRDQLVAFHKASYGPRGSLLIVVGDVRTDAVLRQLESAFAGWKGQGEAKAAAALPPTAQVQGRQLVVVDRPGSAQTVVGIARLGVDRDTPDYYALSVLNTILGGSFTSRLNQNLREEHGYTYGARSAFDMRHQAGPFYAGAAVQTDKTGPSLVEFFKELEAIRKPISDGEVAKAKNYLAYGYPADLLTTAQLAGELEDLWVYGLEDDFLSSYVDRIQAVTPEQVRQAAQRYIDPVNVVVVMVGDWAAIEPQLQEAKLELGKVRLVKP